MLSYRSYKLIKETLNTNLSDDIIIYKKDKPEEKIDPNEWVIDQIIDVITDVEEIKKYESASGAQNINSDLVAKTVKSGDILWLTALLKPRNKSTAYAIGEMGVIKVKVMETYYGLAKLDQLRKSGHI